jgi:dihydrodipicolinate synthase/N-acetylneuraminate lyase
MTRLEALKELAKKVEVGKWWRDESVAISYCAKASIAPVNARRITSIMNNGSLDAAKALHEAVLPVWSAVVGQNAHHLDWSVFVRFTAGGEVKQEITAADDCPASAWLLAILRALIAQEEIA